MSHLDYLRCLAFNHKSLTVGILAAFALILALPVSAQTEQNSPWRFNIDGGGAHKSEADLEDGDGTVSTDRWFFTAGVDYGFDRRTSLGVSIGGGRSIYHFNEDDLLEDERPWDTIEDKRITMTYRFGLGQTGSMFIVPSVRYDGEKGASSSDSQTWGVFAAAAWRLREGLTIGPGVGVFSRLESGTRFFPILAIDWDISERWNLSTGRGLASSQGPGLTLLYTLNDDWAFGLSGRYENQEFRLDNKGIAAGGIGKDQSLPMIFTAVLTPNERISFSVFAGAEFGGTLKLKDADNEVVAESDYDTAAIFGATFQFKF